MNPSKQRKPLNIIKDLLVEHFGRKKKEMKLDYWKINFRTGALVAKTKNYNNGLYSLLGRPIRSLSPSTKVLHG